MEHNAAMQITIPYEPFPHQAEVHLDKRRFRLLVAGRRAGKTFSAFHDMIAHALKKPFQLCWWVATTYRDAKEIGWQHFLDFQDYLEPAIKSVSLVDLRITFKNGSRVYFKGSDAQDSLRGRGLDFVVVDEAAFQHPDVWRKILRPALSDKQGKAILLSSANGRNWFYEQYSYAKRPDLAHLWGVYIWPTSVNPLISEDDLIAAQNELSSNDFRQEYLAEFVTKAGMVYDDFTEENVIQSFTPTRRYSYFIGIDFGFANPSAIVFSAVDPDGNVIVFDEIYESRLSMEDMTNKINAKLWHYKLSSSDVTFIATDPAGNAEELTSGISPVDYLRQKGGYNVINKGTRIAPGLALVRSYIKNSFGHRRLHIVGPTCPELIRSIYGYTYAPKRMSSSLVDEEPLKDGLNDHACDALRYFMVNRFDHAKYVGNMVPQEQYLTQKQESKTKHWVRCCNCGNKFYTRGRDNICSSCKEKINGNE
jgi:PBSX family phage terminase large subunit